MLLLNCPCQNLFALSCTMYVAAIRYASCIAHLCLHLLPRFDTYNTNKCHAYSYFEDKRIILFSEQYSMASTSAQDSSNSSTTVR